MKTFYEMLNLLNESSWNDKYRGTAQERRGFLKDWIEANKDFIRVKKGYGQLPTAEAVGLSFQISC